MIFYIESMYLALCELLTSQDTQDFLIGLELPIITHIDLFNGQYLNEEEVIAYNLPAIFIEFAQADFTEKGRWVESSLETIHIHIEQKQLGSTAYNSHNRPKSLQTLRYIDALHLIIKGFEGEFFGKFRRIGRRLDTNHGNNPVHILEYQVQTTLKDIDKYRDAVSTTIGEDALKIEKKLVKKIQ